ncbi:hypothetical protein [Jongsikchunia kroppenstedtii]|uniref:hypothetical protein n=1 Tax=Jongsikchunia kroppenstedtii TaxID=1121721 RepID=UPI00035F6919|nr:hypothetical protein [Jongsikchunia kroppenstedtii]
MKLHKMFRRTAVSLLIAGAVLAPAATEAGAAPVQPPIAVNTPFQVPVTFFMGDPVPVATQTVSASGLGGGRVEFGTAATGPMATGPMRYSIGVEVRWINLNTGASGVADIPDSVYPAISASAMATTGAGQIAAIAYAHSGSRSTMVPGLGTFHAP